MVQAGLGKVLKVSLAALVVAACSGGSGGDVAANVPPVVPVSSGKLDLTYDNGIKLIYLGAEDPLEMAVDANGKVSVGGSGLAQFDVAGRRIVPESLPGLTAETSPLGDEAGNLFTLGRLTVGYEIVKRDVEGRLISGFGNAGRLPVDSRGFTGLTRLFRDAAGNSYLLGELRLSNIIGPVTTLVAKLDANGQRVMSYGSGGVAVLPGVYRDPQPAVAVDREGNVYFAAGADGTINPGLRKLDRDGQVVTDFGIAGVAVAPCEGATLKPLVATDAGGNVYLSGACYATMLRSGTALFRAAVWKFDARGNPVSSFGESGGRVVGFFAPMSRDGNELDGAVYGLLPNADGSVYVGASSLERAINSPCAGGFAVVRLGVDGKPAGTFGTNGIALVELRAARPVALGSDRAGRVYILGETPPDSGCPIPRSVPSSFSLFRLA
jgi:hypothetical protein